MLKECKKTGVLTKEVLAQIPGYNLEAVRKAKGAVVIIECAENIPCNPCSTSCPRQAITITVAACRGYYTVMQSKAFLPYASCSAQS